MKKLMLFVVLVLLLTAAFPALAQENVTPWGNELPADAAPAEEQVLTLPCLENKYMDVAASFYDANRSCGAAWMWERLVMMDAQSNLIPGAAESWEMAEDGMSWTFHLRDGLTWSDGSPLLASDFEFALKRQLDPITGSTWGWFYSAIKNADEVRNGTLPKEELGITAIDDKTLVIETKKVCLYLPMIMSYPSSAPVPQKIVEEFGDSWSNNPETCLTNGPWKLAEYTPGIQIVLDANTNYNGIYKPYIQKFIMKPTEGISDLASYQAGEFEGIFADKDQRDLHGADYLIAKNDPELSKELHSYLNYYTRYIFFDVNVAPWNDVRVRQAIAHAIDRQTLIDVIFDGLGTVSYGMLPAGFPGWVEGQNDSYQNYDVELAQSLLAEAGYPGGEGFPEVELYFNNIDSDRVRNAEILEQMLKENLGIQIKLVPMEQKLFNETFNAGNIAFGLHNWAYDYLDPSNFLDVFDPSLGRHKTWNNEEYNRLVEEAAGESDPEKRLAMYSEADRILSEDCGAVFLFNKNNSQLWKSYIKGIPYDAAGYNRVNYYDMGMYEIYIGNDK